MDSSPFSLFTPSSINTSSSLPPTIFRWRLRSKEVANVILLRGKRRSFHVHANANGSQRKRSSGGEIIMVDPLEAKRLAAKQMQEIQAKEKLKRRRQIEAINGAWAMIGLTAGLVVEGQTGKSILDQLVGYWAAAINFFFR